MATRKTKQDDTTTVLEAPASAEQVEVVSLLPHPFTIHFTSRVDTGGEGVTIKKDSITLNPGDNRVCAEIWSRAKKRPGVAARLERGHIAEGFYRRLPESQRELLFDGQFDAPAGARPETIKGPGARWNKRLSAKSKQADRKADRHLKQLGIPEIFELVM